MSLDYSHRIAVVESASPMMCGARHALEGQRPVGTGSPPIASPTWALNNDDKRNAARPPGGFLFQPTPEDLTNLKFQNGTSGSHGRRWMVHWLPLAPGALPPRSEAAGQGDIKRGLLGLRGFGTSLLLELQRGLAGVPVVRLRRSRAAHRNRPRSRGVKAPRQMMLYLAVKHT